MAELKIVAQNTSTISFNYEELKAEILAKAQEYETAVYTADTIGDAKADRAKLNKLKTALNEERLKREREFMLPFMEFKSQVADLISIIDKPIKAIDTQVKEFENAEKEAKRAKCVSIFDSFPHPDWLAYEKIENQKWYNKTASLSSIEEEIAGAIDKVNGDINMIQNYCPNPSVGVAHYKQTLDLKKSLELGRMVAEAEKPKEEPKPVEPAPEEEAEWISFLALLTPTQAKALSNFFKTNNIKFKKGE